MSKIGLKLGFLLGSGSVLKVDDDNYIEDGWIRYKDIYIQVLKGDHGYSISWQEDVPAEYPIRNMLIATPPLDSEGANTGVTVPTTGIPDVTYEVRQEASNGGEDG